MNWVPVFFNLHSAQSPSFRRTEAIRNNDDTPFGNQHRRIAVPIRRIILQRLFILPSCALIERDGHTQRISLFRMIVPNGNQRLREWIAHNQCRSERRHQTAPFHSLPIHPTVVRFRKILIPRIGPYIAQNTAVFQLDNTRLLRNQILRFTHPIRFLPSPSIIIRIEAENISLRIEFLAINALQSMQSHRNQNPPAPKLDNPTVIHHKIARPRRHASLRFRPGLPIILRDTHHRITIVRRILYQIEHRQTAFLQPQQRHRHHILPALIGNHRLLITPSSPAVARYPLHQQCLSIIIHATDKLRIHRQNPLLPNHRKSPLTRPRIPHNRRHHQRIRPRKSRMRRAGSRTGGKKSCQGY